MQVGANQEAGLGERRRQAVLAATLAAATLLGGCRQDQAATPPPAPEAPTSTPSPEPSPVGDVAMSHRVEALSVSAADVLTKAAGITPPRTPIDEAALAEVANRLTALLRDHLDDLNHGGVGRLAELPHGPWGADPAMDAMATTALASPDNPATEADLVLRVGVDGRPRWAQADLVVTRRDGSRIHLDMVLSVEADLRLLVLGGEEVAA